MRKVATFVVAIVILTHTPPMSAAFAEQSLRDKIVGRIGTSLAEARSDSGCR